MIHNYFIWFFNIIINNANSLTSSNIINITQTNLNNVVTVSKGVYRLFKESDVIIFFCNKII